MIHQGFRLLPLFLLLFSLLACTAPAATEPTPGVASPTVQPAATTTSASPTMGATGKLSVLCTVTEELCKDMTEAFEAQSGVETSILRLSSGEALERLGAGQDAPEFDIWYGGPADGYVTAKGQGLLQPYLSPVAIRIPERLKDQEGYWTGAYVGALGLCSNTERLAALGVAVPQGWSDLLDPKLRGQVAMAHPETSGTAYTALWTQVTLHDGNRDEALQYFKQLYDNGLQFTRAGIAPAQMASRGEIAVGIAFFHDCVKVAEESGAAIEATFPEEGTGYEVGGLAIVEGAPNLAAAKSYVDWLLSQEAQELAAGGYYQLPTNPDASIPDRAANQAKLLNYDFVAAGAARSELAERFTAEISPPPPE